MGRGVGRWEDISHPTDIKLVVPFALANEMRWELTCGTCQFSPPEQELKESLCSTMFFSALRPAMSPMGASLQARVPEEQEY